MAQTLTALTAPTVTDWKPKISDPKYADFKMSEQSEQAVKLIEDNDLTKVSGASIDTIKEDLKRFEFVASSKLVSDTDKTAGMVGVISQAIYEAGVMPPDGKYKSLDDMTPAEKEHEQQVNKEIQGITKVIYDDPITNTLHDKVGGYLDLDQAKLDLEAGKSVPAFGDNVMLRNQKILVDAMLTLPVDIQQHATQAAKVAVSEGAQHKNWGADKIPPTVSIKQSIDRNLHTLDLLNHRIGRQSIYGGQKQVFDHAMYDAKGIQVHAENADNPALASNKSPVLITAEVDSSYLTMLSSGINKEVERIHENSRKPHTVAGDDSILYDAVSASANIEHFNNGIAELLEDPDRDKSQDDSLRTAYAHSYRVQRHVFDLEGESLSSQSGLKHSNDLHSRRMIERDIDFERVYRDEPTPPTATQDQAQEQTASHTPAPELDSDYSAPSPMRR